MNKSSSIGIFDSGVGGLTIARAIKKLLPNESIIYFGDTEHFPYGDKSADALMTYSKSITKILLQKGCKLIIIACHSASATVHYFLEQKFRNKIPIINVIDPALNYIKKNLEGSKIGLIGTNRTILSRVYEQGLKEHGINSKLHSLATPLLAPMVEDGFIEDDISQSIISYYLRKQELKDINTLLLACTHYSVIKDQINKFYQNKVKIIDSTYLTAVFTEDILNKMGLLNTHMSREDEFLVSDVTEHFEKITKIFFGKEVHISKAQ